MAYIIRKTILVQIYGHNPMYATLDYEMITSILHLPQDMNKLLSEKNAPSARACTEEYEIDNRSVYDILNQICKDTDLCPYVKQHKLKRDSRGVFTSSISGGWAQIMSTPASEAEMTLGEKKAWNWEKYVAQHVKNHIILGNLIRNG